MQRGGTEEHRSNADQLHLSVLGPVTAIVNGSPLSLGPARQSTLLSVLLCRMNMPVPASVLVDAVWGDDHPASGKQLVSTYAYRLRRVFAAVPHHRAPVIEYGRDGYTLRADPEILDQNRFERLLRVSAAERAGNDTDRSLAALREALTLWIGDPFGSLPGPLLAAERARLRELRLSALEAKLELELATGDPADLLGELQALHLEHPLNERFACQLMTASYRAGRQADALEVYFRTVALLDTELGVRPGAELRDHHRAVLVNDARLDGSPVDRRRGRLAVTEPTVRCDLPAVTGSLMGREDDLDRLTGHRPRPEQSTLITVDGMPGIGKTGLLVRAAHAMAGAHPGGQLYLDLHGSTPGRQPSTPAEALRALLGAIGVRPADLPDSADECAARWRAATTGRALLVLLDDAAGDQQVAPLLPGVGGTVVVASRQALGLHATEAIIVGLLADDAADRLFRQAADGIVGPDADPIAFRRVLRACQGHPLALLSGARWLRRNRAQGLAALAARLGDPITFAGLLRQMSTGTTAGDVPLVQTSLDVLTPDALRLLGHIVTGDGPPTPADDRLTSGRSSLAEDELVDGNLAIRGVDGVLTTPRPIAACVHRYLSGRPADAVAG